MSDNTETTPDRLFASYPHERKHIRWDPTINTGHILSASASIVASLVFVMTAWATVDKRLVVLEEARQSQATANRERQDQVNEKFGDVKERLGELKLSVDLLRRDLQDRKK